MATFRARARAVDMLGRQQIAGIPTAISELFKNAHDAYAEAVRVDFFRRRDLFVLRDDGVGMTKEEFETRWLTIGTESKVGDDVTRLPPTDTGKPRRPLLGEKGIGRLAIAALGRLVLVLTRSRRGANLGDVVAAVIHWSMFRLTRVDLNEIEIPVRTFSGGSLPSQPDISAMCAAIKTNLESFGVRAERDIVDEIRADLDAFDVDPFSLRADLAEPSLLVTGGTQFYIKPVDDSLAADIDIPREKDAAPPLLGMLVGFTNTMTPGHSEPPIQAAFFDHKPGGLTVDLIADRTFFTEDEFRSADHHIAGRFDEFGQFSGTVAVFGQDAVSHTVAWRAARGKRIDCGPFSINLAVVQGSARESRLPPADWANIKPKLDKIGGVYIYRDGVRILPYGRSDYDWLDIERNRTKQASYYYFSYRNIFGVVELDHRRNTALTEKAGREGFVENRAYRQFREVLKNFFVQIAADFFREGGRHSHLYDDRREAFKRHASALQLREKQTRVRRRELREELNAVFVRVESGEPVRAAETIVEEFKTAARAAVALPDKSAAVLRLLSTESAARRKLDETRSTYRVAQPRGIGLPRELRRDWESYREDAARLDDEVFRPAIAEIEAIATELGRDGDLPVDKAQLFEAAVTDVLEQARRMMTRATTEFGRSVRRTTDRLRPLTSEVVNRVQDAVTRIQTEAARVDVARMTDQQLTELRQRYQDEVTSLVEESVSLLQSVEAHLVRLDWTRDKDGRMITPVDVEEAAEEELIELRARAENDLELAQIGMAIEIVNHEFLNTIGIIRTNLKKLSRWAELNPDLQHLQTDLNGSFDHLDSYLSLLTPLHRRLHKSEVPIAGRQIHRFLEDLFADRLLTENVDLTPSDTFLQFRFTGFPSTFYPVFANLVDNALFWLKDRPGPRLITLDVDGDAVLVSDNGPGIDRRDRDVIFERGFSRKPYGRGLGLYISRETLRRAGYSLTASSSSALGGASFLIRPMDSSRDA